jgi:hypothetical protein
MEICEVLPKLRIFIYLFPNLWNYVKFGQKLQKLFIFTKFMEVCQFLVTILKIIYFFQVLVKFLKIIYFCQIYGIMSSFAKIYVKCQNTFFFQKQLLLNLLNTTYMVSPISAI